MAESPARSVPAPPVRSPCLRVSVVKTLALLPLLAGCHSPLPQSLSASTAAASVQFTDVTDTAGIRFVHHNGAFGKKWMPETTGSGCAFLDFDNDGWEDILLVNSGSFSGVQKGQPEHPNTRTPEHRHP